VVSDLCLESGRRRLGVWMNVHFEVAADEELATHIGGVVWILLQ
jgi:hypothetical protein